MLILTLVAFVAIINFRRNLLDLFDPVSYFSIAHIVLFFLAAFYRNFYDLVVPIGESTLMLLCACMLLFAIGSTLPGVFFSAMHTFLFSRGKKSAAYNKNYDSGKIPAFYSNTAWIMFLLGAVGVAIFIVKCGGILWLRSDFDDYRITARAGLGWLVLLSIVFVTYPTISLFSHYLISKKNLKFAALIMFSGMVLVLQFGNRAPAFEIAVICGFIYCWNRWRKVPVVLLVSGGLLLFLLLGIMQVLRQGTSSDFLMVLLQSIWRPFVNIQNFDLIVKAFPSEVPFLNGKSYLMDLSMFAPGHHPNFGTWLKDRLGLDFTGGSVTVTYLGELYSNFGAFGALFGSFVLGVALDALSKYSKNNYYNYCNYAQLSCVAITAKAIVSSGFITPFLYLMVPFGFYYIVFKVTLSMHSILFAKGDSYP
jgi:oligosaccharide repeat unit polymerase